MKLRYLIFSLVMMNLVVTIITGTMVVNSNNKTMEFHRYHKERDKKLFLLNQKRLKNEELIINHVLDSQ